MNELETKLHLFQPPLYRSGNGQWRKTFFEAAADAQQPLIWDPAAILSIISFGYPCGDRTLFNQIKRRPWLCEIGKDKEPILQNIPGHQHIWQYSWRIASELIQRLCDEAMRVCRGRKEIYFLLSGGLDSRVTGAVLGHLYRQSMLDCRPVAVTWGIENCRDVIYAKAIADILGFDWHHINMTRENVAENIEVSLIQDCLISPVHFHCMTWFKNASKEALVLASSYGDSVGRAEFSGKHILELDYLKPINTFGLIHANVLNQAYKTLSEDLRQLRERAGKRPRYALCAVERQGHYMRGMIAHAMSIINNYCTVYQMFTDPSVYRYMWSLHPSVRTNAVYVHVLEQLEPSLAKIPWARNNQTVKGLMVPAGVNLQKEFHNYPAWISGPLFTKICEYIDPKWFEQTGIFSAQSIKNIIEEIQKDKDGKGIYGFIPYEMIMWLAAFRKMAEKINALGKDCFLDNLKTTSQKCKEKIETIRLSRVKKLFGNNRALYNMIRQCRAKTHGTKKCLLRWKAILQYPPVRKGGVK